MSESTNPCGEELTLLDGSRVWVRSIEPTDASALVTFHEGLSAETQRLRFFNCHPHLTAAEVERFTTVDHHKREALVVFHRERLIAVGRYDVVGPNTAEVAFVVADEWQGRGIATMLLDLLAEHAEDEGITHFTAETLGENRPMLDVFRHWAPQRTLTYNDGSFTVDMPLPQLLGV